MLILVRDDRLSHLRPGYIHQELVSCEPFERGDVVVRLKKAGYKIICENPADTSGLIPRDWHNINRLNERR